MTSQEFLESAQRTGVRIVTVRPSGAWAEDPKTFNRFAPGKRPNRSRFPARTSIEFSQATATTPGSASSINDGVKPSAADHVSGMPPVNPSDTASPARFRSAMARR